MPSEENEREYLMMRNSEFKKLIPEEEKVFRDWARKHYTPGDYIPAIWHPAVRAECELMNLEENRKIGQNS